METFFKTLDGVVYFQRDGLPIGKSISKPIAGIYMHWFEKNYVFNEGSRFKDNIVFWKIKMDDIFFIWRGKKEKDNYLPFLDVGIMKVEGKLMTKVYRKPTHTAVH